jgi:hypothetical protein
MCTVLGDGQGGRARGDPTAYGDLDKTGELVGRAPDMPTLGCESVVPPKAPRPARDIQGSQGPAGSRGPGPWGARERTARRRQRQSDPHPPSTSTVSKLIAAWRGESAAPPGNYLLDRDSTFMGDSLDTGKSTAFYKYLTEFKGWRPQSLCARRARRTWNCRVHGAQGGQHHGSPTPRLRTGR